jgi:hypothetical protein
LPKSQIIDLANNTDNHLRKGGYEQVTLTEASVRLTFNVLLKIVFCNMYLYQVVVPKGGQLY